MKPIFVAKIAVSVLTLLIIAGFALVIVKIADKSPKNKLQNRIPATLILPENAQKTTAFGCGDALCISVQKTPTALEIWVIDIKTGEIQQKISTN